MIQHDLARNDPVDQIQQVKLNAFQFPSQQRQQSKP